MHLKDLLGKEIYESQKELFHKILEGGKRELKKRADGIYIMQKEIIAELQDNLVKKAKQKVIKLYYVPLFVIIPLIFAYLYVIISGC